MTTLCHQYPLSLLCRVLEVPRSGYYAWRTRRPSTCAQENARLEVAIQAAHMRTRQTYGPERLQAELRDDGFPAGIGRIKRLRKKLGLRCTQVRRFTTTTESNHSLSVAENVLAQTFVATRPNENTNGLLRQYFPKGTDLSRWNDQEIQAVAHTLNTRPRKTLGWKTPAEALNKYLQFAGQPSVASTG